MKAPRSLHLAAAMGHDAPKNAHSRIHVLAIGGAHQFGHIVPVACELARRHPGQVRLFVSTEAEVAAAMAYATQGAAPEVVVMHLPAAAALLPASMHKSARLTLWAKRLRDAAMILCAERTSTMLRRLPGIARRSFTSLTARATAPWVSSRASVCSTTLCWPVARTATASSKRASCGRRTAP
ncbi:hypothetical protein ACFSLT_09355 [Novosphingobium resinovorum]